MPRLKSEPTMTFIGFEVSNSAAWAYKNLFMPIY